MIPNDWWPGIVGYSILFLANPFQWHRTLKLRRVDEISWLWLFLPILSRFFTGFTATQHPVWLWGNSLIFISCINTFILLSYFRLQTKAKKKKLKKSKRYVPLCGRGWPDFEVKI